MTLEDWLLLDALFTLLLTLGMPLILMILGMLFILIGIFHKG